MKHALLLVLALAAGCHEKQEVTAPPPPLRPEPEPKVEVNVAKDCDPTDPAMELKPITFDQRSIPEGSRLADQAYGNLKAADSAEVDRMTREQYQTSAVNDFITALSADPYNIKATYGLAAAYAKIGRKQCSINLLDAPAPDATAPQQEGRCRARPRQAAGPQAAARSGLLRDAPRQPVPRADREDVRGYERP